MILFRQPSLFANEDEQVQRENQCENSRDKYLSRTIKKFEFYVERSEFENVKNALEYLRASHGFDNNTDLILHIIREEYERAKPELAC